ncbi:MAG: TetR/AcrR family transcriptional regulator [Eubacteriales bacterium]|nr:TetR/AcrR family transcriptional regulator [Eubacteriales bacterium]
MPRDKKLSHKKVLDAAKKEFLEKGFEDASIRSIGARAGMTSAGLYRHCKDKEDLFVQIVDPLFQEMNKRFAMHKRVSYEAIQIGERHKEAFNTGEIKIFLDLSKEFPEELKLLLCRSVGTRYENFIHDLVDMQQKEMFDILKIMEQNGYQTIHITEREMHVLLSAYITAIIEPVVHEYDEKETEHCLMKVAEFFTPGWMKIMGL